MRHKCAFQGSKWAVWPQDDEVKWIKWGQRIHGSTIQNVSHFQSGYKVVWDWRSHSKWIFENMWCIGHISQQCEALWQGRNNGRQRDSRDTDNARLYWGKMRWFDRDKEQRRNKYWGACKSLSKTREKGMVVFLFFLVPLPHEFLGVLEKMEARRL